MKEEKLSHEILLRALDDMFNGHPLPEYATIEKQAYEQIKSLLTPIPKDELDEFVGKWAEQFPCGWCGNRVIDVTHYRKNKIPKMLKEYDKMKEKK